MNTAESKKLGVIFKGHKGGFRKFFKINWRSRMLKKRYFVVGTGRCGTSMLAAIIDSVGGNFANIRRKAKNGRGGYFESDNLVLAYKWYKRANLLTDPVPDLIRRFCRSRADRYLKKNLKTTIWHKFPHFHYHIGEVKRLGYTPVIVGVWRDLWPMAISFHKKNRISADPAIKHWLEVNLNLLFLLTIYPGCLVKFEDIMNHESDIWRKEISRVTEFKVDDLLEARKKIVDDRLHHSPELRLDVLPEEASKLHDALMERTFGIYKKMS